MNPNRILVLYAHAAPETSRVNRRLADAARLVPGVYVHDLYEAYPDFYIDVAREHALLGQAAVVVLLHPIQWYGMPALMKEWCDQVLPDCWSGRGSDNDGVLTGKRCWLVTSTGSPAADFAPGGRHGHPFELYLAPYRQLAVVCGMEWIAPLVLHDAHPADPRALELHVAAFTDRLRGAAGAASLPFNRPTIAAPSNGT
jgi:glutathione-regulated potassium-efflux system ancillary protein KefF